MSKKWKELVEKARAKQLQPQEYNSGTHIVRFVSISENTYGCVATKLHNLYVGTFTLSNLGMFGVDRFDAILPPGQVMT